MRPALYVLLWVGLMDGGWRHPARAQTPAERRAAKDTYIEGLRLLDPASLGPHLMAAGVHLGYVDQETRPGNGQYSCGALSPDQGRAAGAVISPALSKLPDGSLRKLNLRYMILCGGATSGGQRIGGIPVPPLNLLMLDVGTRTSPSSALQHLTLHELYHLVELRFNAYQDAEWQTLFGTGYLNSYAGRLRQSPVGSGKPGFLTAYAETYPHEDRAEIFAWLLLNPTGVVAHIRATGDEVLKRKARYLDQTSRRLLGLGIAPPGL